MRLVRDLTTGRLIRDSTTGRLRREDGVGTCCCDGSPPFNPNVCLGKDCQSLDYGCPYCEGLVGGVAYQPFRWIAVVSGATPRCDAFALTWLKVTGANGTYTLDDVGDCTWTANPSPTTITLFNYAGDPTCTTPSGSTTSFGMGLDIVGGVSLRFLFASNTAAAAGASGSIPIPSHFCCRPVVIPLTTTLGVTACTVTLRPCS